MAPRADQTAAGAPDTRRFILRQSDVLPTMRPRHLTAFKSEYVLSKEGASGGGVQPYLPKSISWFFARSRGGGGGNGKASSFDDAVSAFVFVALREGSLSRFATVAGRRRRGGFGVPSQWSSCEPRAPPLPKQRPHPFLQASGPVSASFFGRCGASSSSSG